jgi:hypothetical protein
MRFVPTSHGGLYIAPADGLRATGAVGALASFLDRPGFLLHNQGGVALEWDAMSADDWITLSPTNGTLLAGESLLVTCFLNARAQALPAGNYTNQITFTNLTVALGNINMIQLLITNATPSRIITAGLAGGQFQLDMPGVAEADYLLETSTNLQDWLALATNRADLSGAWRFNDAQATNFPRRFYRVKSVP